MFDLLYVLIFSAVIGIWAIVLLLVLGLLYHTFKWLSRK